MSSNTHDPYAGNSTVTISATPNRSSAANKKIQELTAQWKSDLKPRYKALTADTEKLLTQSSKIRTPGSHLQSALHHLGQRHEYLKGLRREMEVLWASLNAEYEVFTGEHGQAVKKTLGFMTNWAEFRMEKRFQNIDRLGVRIEERVNELEGIR